MEKKWLKLLAETEGKVFVWMSGTWGTGKTTQVQELCKMFKSDKRYFLKAENCVFTTFGDTVGAVGDVKTDSKTYNRGAASIGFFIKKKVITNSMHSLLNRCRIVLFDPAGIWSFSYLDFLSTLKKDKVKVLFIILNTNRERNLHRIKERRRKQLGFIGKEVVKTKMFDLEKFKVRLAKEKKKVYSVFKEKNRSRIHGKILIVNNDRPAKEVSEHLAKIIIKILKEK